MCESCRTILGRCVKIHEPKSCPLKRGSYCTFCSKYGHTSIRCTKDTSYRSIEIIPDPIKSLVEPVQKKYLDYVDEPKAIRALLKAHGELPRKEERDKDKYKKQLIKMAKKHNLILVPHVLEKDVELI